MAASSAIHVRTRSRRAGQLDPTGEVDVEDPVAVEAAIRSILDRLYGADYDAALLAQAMRDLVAAYRGDHPRLLRCDMLYHDLRHAMETGLTAARLLDGHAKSLAPDDPLRFDGRHGLLGVLLALFHDIGLLRHDGEEYLSGPALIPVHEERGVEFMRDYLCTTTLASLGRLSRLIMATKLVFRLPAGWSPQERQLAGIIATADLLSQCADRCYLEKCRDFLFVELAAFGQAGNADSPFPDRWTLLAKTPGFFSSVVRQRLDEEFDGTHRLLELHTGRGNPWQETIQRNLVFLERILAANDLTRLRRNPQTFV